MESESVMEVKVTITQHPPSDQKKKSYKLDVN